jgi:hypothetical protein
MTFIQRKRDAELVQIGRSNLAANSVHALIDVQFIASGHFDEPRGMLSVAI